MIPQRRGVFWDLALHGEEFLSFRADELENLANGATELGQRLRRHRFDFGCETMFGNRPNLIHHGYPRLALAGDGNGDGRMGARG